MAKCNEKKLKIWVVRMLSGNPFEKDMPERSVQIAEHLAKKGHYVTYWGTAFNHNTKRYDFKETIFSDVRENEHAIMLRVPATYSKDISFKRIIYTWEQAKLLKKIVNSGKVESPDIIFAACPTVETCRVMEKYGKKKNVPVIIDQRDRWPDVFENAFPRIFKRFAHVFLLPLRLAARKMYRQADAICAISSVELEFALNYAGRAKKTSDDYVYIGRRKHIPEQNAFDDTMIKLKELGITDKTWNICFFSSLSKISLDMDTMIYAIEFIHKKHPGIRLIIGGSGDGEELLKELIREKPFIKFLGFLNNDEMSTIMSICKIGIMPYKNATMKNAWGNKIGQYLSFGLPIVSSTEGIAKDYFAANKCGLNYAEGDADSLMHLLNYLIENPDKLDWMSKNAKACFENDFEIDKVMKRLENVILNAYEKYNRK